MFGSLDFQDFVESWAGGTKMSLLDIVIIVILLAWLTGNFALHLGSLVHLLLVLAIVVLIVRLIQGRPVV